MKKLLTILLLTASVSVLAHGPHYGHYYHHGGGGWNWVAPAVIGGAVVYAATRPAPVVVQQPQVIYPPQNCGPWTEVRNIDGTTTMSRTCYGVQ